MGMLPNRSTSGRSQTNYTESRDHNNGAQELHRMESGRMANPLPELNGEHDIHSLYSGASTVDGFHSGIPMCAPTETVGQNYIHRHAGHERFPDQSWPVQRAPTSGTIRPNSTITQSHPSDHKKTTFPELTMEEVSARRAKGKSPKLRGLLSGEDQAMIFLKQRDHVSLRTRF